MAAEDIRRFCIENYIEPARSREETEVVICAGNVHREMGLNNRFPQVCDSIRTGIFAEQANVRCVRVDGPRQGATTTFTFLLL
jgi:5-methylcytosine-specific restriction protein B